MITDNTGLKTSPGHEVHHLRKNHLTCVHLADSKGKKAEKRIPN